LANPISTEMSSMRPSLLPGLIAAVQRNRNRGFADQALFEVGQAYRGDAPEDQLMAASGVRAGAAPLVGPGRHWSGAAQEFGLFEGESLGQGKKSLALEVTLQPREKTLTDQEIEAVAAKVVAAVAKATGGEIRK